MATEEAAEGGEPKEKKKKKKKEVEEEVDNGGLTGLTLESEEIGKYPILLILSHKMNTLSLPLTLISNDYKLVLQC